MQQTAVSSVETAFNTLRNNPMVVKILTELEVDVVHMSPARRCPSSRVSVLSDVGRERIPVFLGTARFPRTTYSWGMSGNVFANVQTWSSTNATRSNDSPVCNSRSPRF